MIAGIPRERGPGESRVAMIPADLPRLEKLGVELVVESGAGFAAGFTDDEYRSKGATVVDTREAVYEKAEAILRIRSAGADPGPFDEELSLLRGSHVVVGQADPLGEPEASRRFAETGATLFALELIPRITRAQSMDVLSSQASIAGYKAVLLAAEALPRMFPMFNTAAGTVKPAKVLVVGAGVAGLQAIATARRLGAVVHGYDIRPAVKEQIESLGAKFVEIDLGAEDAETAGGYAKEQSEEMQRRQRELMKKVVASSDVVITTAAVPGRKAPIILDEEMTRGMSPGSVVVDLAAERGGNCALTEPGETVDVEGVKILGPRNVPATVPYHASQMYARNVVTFLGALVKDGALVVDTDDEVLRDTLVARGGEVVHARVRESLGLPELPSSKAEKTEGGA